MLNGFYLVLVFFAARIGVGWPVSYICLEYVFDKFGVDSPTGVFFVVVVCGMALVNVAWLWYLCNGWIKLLRKPVTPPAKKEK